MYSRGIKVNILWLIPTVYILALIAKPFFTVWAGEDFGRESVVPFYILLSGIVVNIVAYFPHTAILASGKTEVLAKLYWLELPFYLILVWGLTKSLGIYGTAIAWTFRVVADAVLMFILANKFTGLSYKQHNSLHLVSAAFIMAVGLCVSFLFSPNVFVVLAASFAVWVIYGFIVYRWLIDQSEIDWLWSILKARHAR